MSFRTSLTGTIILSFLAFFSFCSFSYIFRCFYFFSIFNRLNENKIHIRILNFLSGFSWFSDISVQFTIFNFNFCFLYFICCFFNFNNCFFSLLSSIFNFVSRSLSFRFSRGSKTSHLYLFFVVITNLSCKIKIKI